MMKFQSKGQGNSFISLVCVFSVSFFFILSNPAAASWTSGGPYGGYITCMDMAPANPDIVFAGTFQGLYKSTDAGKSWSKTGFPEIHARSVKIDPDNPASVYAGTDQGINKSSDGGASWNVRGLSTARINTIAVDPDVTGTVYAGTGWPWSMKKDEIIGIYKSMDGGKTWQQLLSGDLDAVMTVLIDTRNSAHIYAGAYNESWGGGFYRSLDAGKTWESKNVSSGSWDKVVALAMSAGSFVPGVIFAIGEGPDVYKSDNQGESWTRCNVIDAGAYQSYPLGLAVDPKDPRTVYVGNWNRSSTPFKGGVFKTTDGGDNWVGKTIGLPTSVVTGILIDPRNNSLLIGLDDGGFYKSEDKANSWINTNEKLLNTLINSLAPDPKASDTLYATVQGENHLAKSTSAGESWQYLTGSPTHLGVVAIDPQIPSTIWVGDGYRSGSQFYVHKSTDSGLTWSSMNFFTIYGGGGGTGVKDIIIHPTCSDCLLVGTDFGLQSGSITGSGILARSTNGGLNWQQLGTSTTALAVDPNYHDVVYRGKRRIGQIFRYGNAWNSASSMEITPLDGEGNRIIGDVTDIVVDSNSEVYVAASTGLWAWDGSAWKHFVNTQFDGVAALAIDRTTSPETLYIGTTEEGVFYTQDGGGSWTPFNESLDSLSIKALAVSGGFSKKIYAGTRYGGAWSRALGKDTSGLVEAFVTRFYQLCLNRNPDSVGLKGWVNSLLNGTLSGSDVAYGFVFSPEFLEQDTANAVFLKILYRAFFNREPDPNGWDAWMAELEKGTDREHVLKGFIYAKEFNELCRSFEIMPNPVGAFVTRFYQLCLKRNPDIPGLEGWVASLLSGNNVGADVAEGFIFSPEFTNTVISHSEYLDILYKAFFNRDPDPAGFKTWLDELNSGTDRTQVLNGFIYSVEFGELCRKFGIIPFR